MLGRIGVAIGSALGVGYAAHRALPGAAPAAPAARGGVARQESFVVLGRDWRLNALGSTPGTRPLARETRVEPGKASGVIATVYQLIDRGTSAEYAAAVKAVAGARPDLSIRVTGPAPCYAFT